MTLDEFKALPHVRQIATVLATGTFLATRRVGEHAVRLYHLPGGVFAELYYDTTGYTIACRRSFTSSAPLADYAAAVQLPDGW